MYKVDAKITVVKLESPDGDAILKFKTAKANDALEMAGLIERFKAGNATQDDLRRFYVLLHSDLISIENMAFADGTPVTIEDFRNLELSIETLMAIAEARTKAREAAKPKDKEAEEKKDDSGDSLSA